MRKSIFVISAALLLGASSYALAETARPQSSTTGSSSSTNPSSGSAMSSFPGSPGQMSESQIKQRLEQQGYSNVTMQHYTGTAQKNGKQVQIEVDGGVTVTEK